MPYKQVETVGEENDVGEGRDGIELLLRKTAKRLRALERQINDARKNPDEEAIHDLRIAIRRLAAACVCAEKFEPKSSRRTRNRLNRLMKPLGRLRDAHVQMELFEQAGAEHLPGTADLLERYRRRRRRREKDVRRALRSFRTVKPGRKLVARLKEMTRGANPPGLSRENAVTEIINLWGEAESWRDRATDPCDAEGLHRMRLALKKTRYTAEIFSRFAGLPGVLLKEMNAVQTCMGEIHDCDALLDRLGNPEFLGELAIRAFIRNRRAERHRDFAKALVILEKRMRLLSVRDGAQAGMTGTRTI
ncbi:MAG TPA: CHAD domain-containing protein [Candidatus Brocadiia bacterium]|nr:CHAD domain-containing protein [Candidatus Brocadiia bacterium]